VALAVKYCASPAGRVAYSVSGAGPALLCDSGWITDLRGQLSLYSFGDFLSGLAERFTVIRYDKPGCGLSDREGGDLSLAGQVSAAMAVADAVGARRFGVFGASQGGHVAATIAARYPDRVDALALYGTCVDGRALASADVRASVVALVRAHWGLGLRVLAEVFVADPSEEEVAAFHRFQRVSSSGAVAGRLLEVYYDTDLAPVLPRVQARTAVLHRVSDTGTPFELGREVAASIPGATLIPLSGSSHLYYHGEWQEVLASLLGFLGAGQEDPSPLTRRESQVAVLIAAGLTNHAIASRLSVAPRTAESHVENIRRKLGVRSRAQIAAWVTENPPASTSSG